MKTAREREKKGVRGKRRERRERGRGISSSHLSSRQENLHRKRQEKRARES